MRTVIGIVIGTITLSLTLAFGSVLYLNEMKFFVFFILIIILSLATYGLFLDEE
jgi:hypothetical protein